MATQEYRNIWDELEKIHKQLLSLNDNDNKKLQEIKALLSHDDSNVIGQQKSKFPECEYICKELDEIHKQLAQLNDKSTIGTCTSIGCHNSGLTTSPPIKRSEPNANGDEGRFISKHRSISTQTNTSTNLCIPDLNEVLETLRAKGCDFGEARWMDLGLALGLYMSTLKIIKRDCYNSHECLMETLDKWMRRADNVMSKGRPSWDTLADALRRIDENTSAQYIIEQRMRLEALSASNDAVRDGAIINVVKDASQSLLDQNMAKIGGLLEKMESITSKPQEDINHQLMEMKKEIKQLNEINEQLKVHLNELSQLKNKLEETDLVNKRMSHDLDKYKSLYETAEVQLQSKNREIQEINDRQKKAAVALKQLEFSSKDITEPYQLEIKTKQLPEELTEIHMMTKLEEEQLKQQELEQTSVEIKQEMEEKILSLSDQLREREEENKQLSTDIKNLQFQYETNKSLKEMSDKVASSVYLLLVKEVPPCDPNDTEKEKRVKWDMSGSGSVTLRSPTPSDCITVVRQISIDGRPCEMIRLYLSSTDSTIILLSLLHQTNVIILRISDTQLSIEAIHCVGHLVSINQLKYLYLNNASLSTSEGLNLLTDAISTNTSLGELSLLNDRLTEDDMMNISQALTINTTLQQLYLVDCYIIDIGLVQLSNGLKQNKTLKVLNIRYNDLITSTTAVCDIIYNSSVTHLDLHKTSLPSDSIPQLIVALSSNKTIRRLVIDKRHRERCRLHKNYQLVQDRLNLQ